MKISLFKWSICTVLTAVTIIANYAFAVLLNYTDFAFAWFLNFSLMTWYTALIAQLKPPLAFGYFKARPFEKQGQVYKYAGVTFFRKLLVWMGWEKITRKANPIIKDTTALKVIEYNTRVSELGHTIIAILVLLTTIGLYRSWSEAKWLIGTNILLNIYPIFLQRFNRPRFARILNRNLLDV